MEFYSRCKNAGHFLSARRNSGNVSNNNGQTGNQMYSSTIQRRTCRRINYSQGHVGFRLGCQGSRWKDKLFARHFRKSRIEQQYQHGRTTTLSTSTHGFGTDAFIHECWCSGTAASIQDSRWSRNEPSRYEYSLFYKWGVSSFYSLYIVSL